MDQPKRKHVSTGKKPPGGAREGAGRTKGLKNMLGYGEVKALDVANLRVPDDASEGAKTLAAMGLGRILDVMLERTSSWQAGHVLKAATRVREEVCGPLVQKVQHAGANGEALVVEIRKEPNSNA